MDVNLRKAEPSDMTAVLSLIKELAAFENEPEAVEITEKQLREDGFGQTPSFQAIVAEINGKVIGMALFYYRYSTWKGRTIHLEDLIVNESYRNKGIGAKLYAEVLRYAQAQGLKRVEWNVLDWNKVAIDFYESTGAKLLEGWRVVQMDEQALQKYINPI